jgi:hypothetical protein
MTGMALSKPATWQFLNALRVHPVIELRKRLEDFGGSVRGSIIDDNYFELHVLLRENTEHRLSDSRHFISCCQDDRALNVGAVRASDPADWIKFGPVRQPHGPLQMK